MNHSICCSCLTLTSRQGNPYWLRTCDLHTSVWEAGAHAVSFPAAADIPLTTGVLHAHHALLGISYSKTDTWLLDGINDQGLTGGLLFLEEGTSAAHPDAAMTGVMGMELVTYLLATCSDVPQVCRTARAIQIMHVPNEADQVNAAMHYFFADAQGGTVVLEAADPAHPGRLVCYCHDSIGVLTNSPPYPRQLDNLRWFLSQSPELHRGGDDCPICQPAWEGVRLTGDPDAPHLTASGALPASFAPYDRFVRLAVLKALNHDGRWMEDAQMLPLGSGLLHCVFEPRNQGVYHYRHLDEAGMPVGRKDGHTQYEVMYDICRHSMFLRPYDSTAWTEISLSACDTTSIQQHSITHDPMAGVVQSRSM